MTKIIIRHGDVDIRPGLIPSSAKKTDTKTLAYGEVTGHHHSFAKSAQVLVFEPTNNDTVQVGNEAIPVQKYLRVKQDSVLSHQEHNPLTIPKGDYVILQERTYDPFKEEIKKVID